MVVSFLFWNRIREPLISLGRVGCLNFHPAPLPDFRGVGGYNVAILEGLPEWGVSCHFVDEHFDTGDLVEVERFPIDPDAETALSLDMKSQEQLLAPVRARGGARCWPARSCRARPRARAATSRARSSRSCAWCARATTSTASCARFWYPPWPGAVVELDGRRLTLVDDELLAEVARAYRDAGLLP